MLLQQIPGAADAGPDDLVLYAWSAPICLPVAFDAPSWAEPAGPAVIVAMVGEDMPLDALYLWARLYRMTDEERERRHKEREQLAEEEYQRAEAEREAERAEARRVQASRDADAGLILDALWAACFPTSERPALSKLSASVLKALCVEAGVRSGTGKWDGVQRLNAWAYGQVDGGP